MDNNDLLFDDMKEKKLDPLEEINEEKRKYKENIDTEVNKKKSMIFAIIVWLFSIFFAETVLKAGFGITTPIVTAILIGILLWYYKGNKISLKTGLFIAGIFILSLSLFITYSFITHFITFIALLYLIPALVVTLSGYSKDDLFSTGKFIAGWFGNFIKPFTALFIPFKILANSKKSFGFKVFIAFMAALPFLLIFTLLFKFADLMFDYTLNNIIETIGVNIGDILFSIITGSIISVFLIATYVSLKASSERSFSKPAGKGFVDSSILTIFHYMILVVFLGFNIIQFLYLFSNKFELPETLTYSVYATQGFYQLCAVVFISVILVVATLKLAKKDEDTGKYKLSLKFVLTFIVLSNFVVAVSSLFRMYKYISAYDLSIKRLVVIWFIFILIFILIGLLIKVWNIKFALLSYLGVTWMIFIIVLNFMNVNKVVADYNVNQYLKDPEVNQIDLDYLAKLGPGAISATAKLKDMDLYKSVLTQQKFMADERTWRNMTLDVLLYRHILEELKITGYFDENTKDEYFGYDEINSVNFNYLYDPYGFNYKGIDENSMDRNGMEVYRIFY